MLLWKRIWCWIAGHDWVQLLTDPDKAANLAHLHAMAGCMGYCARCGFMWNDLSTAPPAPPPDLGSDPYRTAPTLPACKCRGRRVHPDCPRHLSTDRQPAPISGVTRTVTIRVTVNGKDVTLSGDAAKQVESLLDKMDNDFERSFDRMDQTFDRMDSRFGDLFKDLEGMFQSGSRVRRVRRTKVSR